MSLAVFRNVIRRLGGRVTQAWEAEIPVEPPSRTNGAYKENPVWARITLMPDGSVDGPIEEPSLVGLGPDLRRQYREVLRAPPGYSPQRQHHADTPFLFMEEGGARFALIRRELPGGDKQYQQWHYTSAGWVAGLPSIDIPLFGIHLLNAGHAERPIMIHEGPKGVMAANAITGRDGNNPQIDHPLYEWLSEFLHLGWHGGAGGLYYTDWTPLRGKHVYFFADMDEAGITAAKAGCGLALHYGARSAWFTPWLEPEMDANPTWDMGDALRGLPHDARGRTIGAEDMEMRFQRWFTVGEWVDSGEVDKKGKPKRTWKLRDDFARAWVYAEATGRFHMLDAPTRSFDKDGVDDAYASLADGHKVGQALIRSPLVRHVEQPVCLPGVRHRLVYQEINGRSVLCVNVFIPSRVKPRRPPGLMADGYMTFPPSKLVRAIWPQVARTLRPLMRLARNIAPDPRDRLQLLMWCARAAARPSDKMKWATILISEQQGIGKTTFINFLQHLVGRWNSRDVAVKTLSDNNFTPYFENTCLLNLEEMDSSGTREHYNHLKRHITDRMLTVRKKFQTDYEQPNYINYIGSSNRPLPILLENSDRRWFPVESNAPRVMDTQEAIALHRWFYEEGGANVALYMAQWWCDIWDSILATNSARALEIFNPYDAPTNQTKLRMIENSKADWETALLRIVDDAIVEARRTADRTGDDVDRLRAEHPAFAAFDLKHALAEDGQDMRFVNERRIGELLHSERRWIVHKPVFIWRTIRPISDDWPIRGAPEADQRLILTSQTVKMQRPARKTASKNPLVALEDKRREEKQSLN